MAVGTFGMITKPPLALYEPSRMSFLMPTVKSAHDAVISAANNVNNLVMVVVGCEFWGSLAECQAAKGAH